eukprot:scaffold175254_cov14-Tisochrysis_lutea.AAC.1
MDMPYQTYEKCSLLVALVQASTTGLISILDQTMTMVDHLLFKMNTRLTRQRHQKVCLWKGMDLRVRPALQSPAEKQLPLLLLSLARS